MRTVSAFAPRPDVAYILDADPEAARARKPEYPVDFMHLCRNAYLQLARIVGHMTVIAPLPLEEAKRSVEAAFTHALPRTTADTRRLDTAPIA